MATLNHYPNTQKVMWQNKQVTYKFSQRVKGSLYTYYDDENNMALHIFESGWKGYYQCIIESGEYETTDIFQYKAQQIETVYGIKTFTRKEKLNKLKNQS